VLGESLVWVMREFGWVRREFVLGYARVSFVLGHSLLGLGDSLI